MVQDYLADEKFKKMRPAVRKLPVFDRPEVAKISLRRLFIDQYTWPRTCNKLREGVRE